MGHVRLSEGSSGWFTPMPLAGISPVQSELSRSSSFIIKLRSNTDLAHNSRIHIYIYLYTC